VKEPNMFHNYCETEKITRKASDATENLQLHCVPIKSGPLKKLL